MNKKQKIAYVFNVFLIIFLTIFAFHTEGQTKTNPPIEKPKVVVIDEPIIKDGINLKKLQETHQNQDIVAYVKIPDVMESIIVQADDNEYYLRRLLDGSYNIKGTPFMDFRTTFENRKILIYGHSGDYNDLPFNMLHNYKNEEYYKEHPNIYLYSMDKKYTYKIFASYLERNDYDYVNINSFRGLTWYEHITKLKNKSEYDTGVSINENSKIIILQTCDTENINVTGKYRLTIGVLIKIEDNLYEE